VTAPMKKNPSSSWKTRARNKSIPSHKGEAMAPKKSPGDETGAKQKSKYAKHKSKNKNLSRQAYAQERKQLAQGDLKAAAESLMPWIILKKGKSGTGHEFHLGDGLGAGVYLKTANKEETVAFLRAVLANYISVDDLSGEFGMDEAGIA